MTNQEIFNIVVSHLRKQNCKSQTKNGKCLYRGPNGTKCAIGCLITDEEYDRQMDNFGYGFSLYDLITLFPSLNKLSNNANYNLLHRLQYTHDRCEVKDWEEEFKKVASDFELEIPLN